MDNLLMFQISFFFKMWVGGWSNPKPPFFGERKGGHPTPPPTPQNAQPNQFIPINKLACYGNNLSRNPLQGQLGGGTWLQEAW